MTRALGLVLLVIVLARAQAREEQPITVDVDLVDVYFTVCNSKGRLIPDLRRESFTIFEDDRPQVITNFTRETDLPLTIALLMDTSGSVLEELGFEREAAIKFLYTTLRRDRDKAAVFTFDSAVELKQDYTNDVDLLAKAVKQTRSGGATRLFDALHLVIQGRLGRQEGRRGIIVLTDGEDNSSSRSLREVIEAAQRYNVAIYAISVNAAGARFNDFDRSAGVLEMFGSETGGQTFFPTRLKQLSTHFKRISDELRSQYTIAYRSTNTKRDGTFRKIRIDVKSVGYSVRARSGYYAPTRSTAVQN